MSMLKNFVKKMIFFDFPGGSEPFDRFFQKKTFYGNIFSALGCFT